MCTGRYNNYLVYNLLAMDINNLLNSNGGWIFVIDILPVFMVANFWVKLLGTIIMSIKLTIILTLRVSYSLI